MYAKIAIRLILHNYSASAGSILGVISIVFLMGVEIATFCGVVENIANVMSHSGVDYWVVSKNTVNVDYAGLLPVSYIDRISGLAEVDYVKPLVNTQTLLRNKDGSYELALLTGVKLPEMIGGPWAFEKGSTANLLDPYAITLDTTTLEAKGHPRLGQLVDANKKKVRFAAITKNIRVFRGDQSFISESNARQLSGIGTNKTNSILVKLKPGMSVEETLPKLQKLLPFASVYKTADIAYSTVVYWLVATGIGGSLALSAGLAAGIGIIIIALTIYNNILGFSDEIAILRVIGARKRDIVMILLYQVMIIALSGLFVGFLFLGVVLELAFGSRLPIALPYWFGPTHAGLTLLLSLVASLFAMRHALKIDPAKVFR